MFDGVTASPKLVLVILVIAVMVAFIVRFGKGCFVAIMAAVGAIVVAAYWIVTGGNFIVDWIDAMIAGVMTPLGMAEVIIVVAVGLILIVKLYPTGG